MSNSTDLSPLKEFLSRNPHIHHATPSSPDYSSLRSTYIIDDALQPPMIIRPQSANDVSELLPMLTSHSISFTVRSGGHDMFGRGNDHDNVTIDMRDIAHVNIDKASLSARVGGGIIIMDLLTQLHKEGLVTAFGTVPTVGYAGWATHGGYGIMSANYGLGVDQILGAKIVNGEGKIVDADEKLLKGIRGGGGAFGIIVELTIKIYELGSVLGGLIIFRGESLQSVFKQYLDGYRALSAEGLPAPLGAHPAIINKPEGKGFGVLFLWSSSDLETGDIWLKKICSLAPVAMHTCAKTTVRDWASFATTMVPESTHGTIVSLNLKGLTPDVVDVLADYAEKMTTEPHTMFGIHQLRGPGTGPHPDSVFPERQPHFLVEMLPTATSAEGLETSVKWAMEFRQALMKTDPNNILPTLYLCFASPEGFNLPTIFGDQYETLAGLKQAYDSQNVFKSALARF